MSQYITAAVTAAEYNAHPKLDSRLVSSRFVPATTAISQQKRIQLRRVSAAHSIATWLLFVYNLRRRCRFKEIYN